jgi:hypothetical protein
MNCNTADLCLYMNARKTTEKSCFACPSFGNKYVLSNYSVEVMSLVSISAPFFMPVFFVGHGSL